MINTSGMVPLDTRVIVYPDPVEDKKGSILLPDQVLEKQEWAVTKATLVAVGANAFMDWGKDALAPEVGNKVIIAQYAGKIHEGIDGKKYRVCNDEDILAIVESN